MFIPNSVADISTLHLHDRLESNAPLFPYYAELTSKGWRFYVVDQSRGRCYYGPKVITIPLWVMSPKHPNAKQIGYFDWYCAHEMSHAYAGYAAKHGPAFMAWLKKICPTEYQGYETGYKARHAIAAGLSLDCFLDDF